MIKFQKRLFKITKKIWSNTEIKILMAGIIDNKFLSEIKIQLPSRSNKAIIRKAYRLGYSCKTENEEIRFHLGIKRRIKLSNNEPSKILTIKLSSSMKILDTIVSEFREIS